MIHRLIPYVALLILLPATALQTSAQSTSPQFQKIYSLIKEKNFFKAREVFNKDSAQLTTPYRCFTDAVLQNAFNKPAASDKKIDILITGNYALPDSLRLKLFRIKEDNAIKQYDYATAYTTLNTVLADFKNQLTKEEVKDMQNSLKIWEALKDQPKQKVTIGGYNELKMQKDKAGLKNLPVTTGNDTLPFIFDTGANISTITESTAKRMQMTIIPAAIEVSTITGNTVAANLAVCKKFRLGNIDIENAVFLVLRDKELSFPQISYQIHGILGYPVIEALKEVQLTIDDYLIIPLKETAMPGTSNLAIDGLTPLIYIDDMNFTFDTGADHTILYGAFYRQNKARIDKTYKLTKVSLGGAGGHTVLPGFKISHSFTINGKSVPINNISLLRDNISNETGYGNIGQDVIKQFGKMTINFDQMFIKLD
ncbi:retropepsin-like aspartic protease [Chitinophaga sp. sic0106]|uniref:retropepsin-like aspartic protease n=1 Tax=Chitinophaga sp. sic0106 TaxID=2854785 RepID=UPI001C45DD6F|nr:retropepsin-like aspartic protease [Chitinophaga sp. sic0106]MBV7532725.1 retropepsin-like domain-containing protein [Chitinophaga sp. sic0106]